MRRILFAVFAFCGVLGSFAYAQAEQTSDPTYTDLRNIIREKRPKTIKDLLLFMKEKYPTYFKHHTLAYESRSLHLSLIHI